MKSLLLLLFLWKLQDACNGVLNSLNEQEKMLMSMNETVRGE